MWILIIVLIGSRAAVVTTVEFSNQARCEAAAFNVGAKIRSSDPSIYDHQEFCVRK